MHVAGSYPHLEQVVGEVLRHLLRQGRDQHPLLAHRPLLDLVEQVVDLSLRRPDHHFGINQAGGPDDLLHHLSRVGHLELARRGR